MKVMKSAVRKTLAIAAIAAVTLGAAGSTALTYDVASAAAKDEVMTSSSLLQLEEITKAGLAVDSGTQSMTGNQQLDDAGRFDEGCLSDKWIRSITGAKKYPEPGTAKAYFDATWTSTIDKDVWITESIAEGKNAKMTASSVKVLKEMIVGVQECQEDPAQGHYYGAPHTVKAGTATATYYLDYNADGSTAGGGVAVIRDGNRFGIVSVMAAEGRPGVTLRKIARTAAAQLR